MVIPHGAGEALAFVVWRDEFHGSCFAGGEGSGEAISGKGSWEAFFLKISAGKEKRPTADAEGRLGGEVGLAVESRLLFVTHFRSRGFGGLDFLELREWAQAGRFGFTGAAAGGDEQSGSGNDKCGENADHGSVGGRFGVESRLEPDEWKWMRGTE